MQQPDEQVAVVVNRAARQPTRSDPTRPILLLERTPPFSRKSLDRDSNCTVYSLLWFTLGFVIIVNKKNLFSAQRRHRACHGWMSAKPMNAVN